MKFELRTDITHIEITKGNHTGSVIEYIKDGKPHRHRTLQDCTERTAEIILDQLPERVHEENALEMLDIDELRDSKQLEDDYPEYRED